MFTNWLQSQLRGAEEKAESDGDELTGICLVSGVTEQIARLHEPKIKGVSRRAAFGGAVGFFQ